MPEHDDVVLDVCQPGTINRASTPPTSMMKPNFFIIGAPKCGTTSLAAWLAEHPQIYFSPTKEPHFFNTDHKRFLNSLQSYEKLFAGASKHHCSVGEASVWYMYSSAAVPNILEYNSDAKFIVMLRNPIEMAPSLHEELVFTGREDVNEFSEAWQLQDLRRNGPALAANGLGAEVCPVRRLVQPGGPARACIPIRSARPRQSSPARRSFTRPFGHLPLGTRVSRCKRRQSSRFYSAQYGKRAPLGGLASAGMAFSNNKTHAGD